MNPWKIPEEVEATEKLSMNDEGVLERKLVMVESARIRHMNFWPVREINEL